MHQLVLEDIVNKPSRSWACWTCYTHVTQRLILTGWLLSLIIFNLRVSQWLVQLRSGILAIQDAAIRGQ